MKTKISCGGVIDVFAPSGGVVSGVGVLIGKLFGIPVTTQAVGETVAIHTDGVFDHVAEGAGSGQAWAVGDIVFFDATNKRLTKTATANTRVGVAVAAKLTTDTTGRFRIDPVIT
jgi:predicted RecA/RadA family phage recombinase